MTLAQFAALQEAFEATIGRLQEAREHYLRHPTLDHLVDCLALTRELAGICADASKCIKVLQDDRKSINFQIVRGGEGEYLNAPSPC